MTYTFPHYESKRECIIPDLAAWRQLSKGMTFAEVSDILGGPISDPLRGEIPKQVKDNYFSYGWIDLPYVPHPRTYSFLLGFDSNARLRLIESPFGDAVSDQGTPSKPTLLSPKNGSEFHHYPRIIDTRWMPPAGDYPMRFEIQIGVGNIDGSIYCDETLEEQADGLFFCFNFVGAQPGRVRVRAINGCGTGPWSDFTYFKCLT